MWDEVFEQSRQFPFLMSIFEMGFETKSVMVMFPFHRGFFSRYLTNPVGLFVDEFNLFSREYGTLQSTPFRVGR